MSDITRHTHYRRMRAIKQRFTASQTRPVLAVDAELQGLAEQMGHEPQSCSVGMKGFSRTSLFSIRQFDAVFSLRFEVVPQPLGQMPRGHVESVLRALVRNAESRSHE